MNQEKIGKFIASSRKKKNMTQEELAEKINVTNKAISKWENGRGLPDCSLFNSICNVLDISIEELLSGENSPKNDNVITEYMTYKEKQKKKMNIFILLINIMLFVIFLFILFFINNYKNINIYRLRGESENFRYTEGIFVQSNIKSIFKSGLIDIKNAQITEKNISGLSLVLYNDNEYYSIYSTSNDEDTFIIDDYGYDEYFPSSSEYDIPNNLYLFISYRIDDTIHTEKMKLESEKILTNNKIVYKKIDSITNNKNLKKYEIKESVDLKGYKNILLQDGFVEGSYEIMSSSDKYLQKQIGKDEYIVIDYISKQFYYFYRKDDLSIKSTFNLDSEQAYFISLRIRDKEKSGYIGYDLVNEIMDENSFPSQTEKAKEIINLILEYRKNYREYKLKQETQEN